MVSSPKVGTDRVIVRHCHFHLACFGLFLAELVFRTVGAAIWASEPFGWRGAVGSALILAASALEVVLTPRELEAQPN